MIGNQAHICEWMKQINSPFYKVRIYKQNDLYYFEHKSFASEDDVVVGEAKYVGEMMTSSSFQIVFCPFCGKQLGEISSLFDPLK
jgi:hypothetical protein